MNELVISNIADMKFLAESIVKSNLFGIKKFEEAIVLMAISQAEGRHPALAARDYDIIQGRPSKKSEAMLRDFLTSGGSIKWHALDDTIADATFSHPAGGSVRIAWDMKRAVAAGLGTKDMWKKYPRQMLRARVVSEGIRTVCPMATSGMYVPEEVQDFDDAKGNGKQPAMMDVTPERPEPSEPAEQEAIEPKLTIADVRAAAKKAIARLGKDVVLTELAVHGWQKAEDVPEEKFADVVALLEGM